MAGKFDAFLKPLPDQNANYPEDGTIQSRIGSENHLANRIS